MIPVHIKLKKATSHEKPLTRLQISKVLKDAPDFNDKLSNFGDVDYEGHQKVLNRAISAYSDMPAIDAKHTIYSDFYNGHPEHFLKTFTKHTGYDHSRHIQPTGEHHVVVFHPNMIKSVNAKFEKESSNLLESLKEFLAPYGYCPVCGCVGTMREKRIDGNDICENNHIYPSAKSLSINIRLVKYHL